MTKLKFNNEFTVIGQALTIKLKFFCFNFFFFKLTVAWRKHILIWWFIFLFNCCPNEAPTLKNNNSALSQFARSLRVFKHPGDVICYSTGSSSTQGSRDKLNVVIPLLTAVSFLHRDLEDVDKGIRCPFWWHYLPVFILSDVYLHNSKLAPDTSQPGYHEN